MSDAEDRKRAEGARKQAQILAQLDQDWPAELERLAFSARHTFAQYQAYLKAGFNPEQAISLLRKAT